MDESDRYTQTPSQLREGKLLRGSTELVVLRVETQGSPRARWSRAGPR